LIGSVLTSGPYAVAALLGSPGREAKSDSKDAACLYHL